TNRAPDYFTRALVHRDQVWSARRWNERMAFILAVGRTDHQEITHRQHFAIARLMWKDTQGRHVELPGHIGCSVTNTIYVEATELTLGGDVVQPVPFHIRCACRRRQEELSQAAVHSRSYVLPKERAISHAKRHEHTCIFPKGVIHLPRIVGTDIDHI